jgi:hypothetical protein
MQPLHQYQNGNCSVSIFPDGTKIRDWEGVARPEFPESIDVKCTDWCDAGCAWCHEKSTKNGKHANIEILENMINGLPAGVEIALGGGDPISYPELERFLRNAKSRGLIVNITVNAKHIERSLSVINRLRSEKLVYGIGISYNGEYHPHIEKTVDENTVIHVIAGVNSTEEILRLPRNWKILVLGYKNYGFGEKYYKSRPVQLELDKWKYWIGRIMRRFHVSFDNLALSQLNVKQYLSEDDWDINYMGDDGKFTMYVDAVTVEYAKSSTSVRRNGEDLRITDMFPLVQSCLV